MLVSNQVWLVDVVDTVLTVQNACAGCEWHRCVLVSSSAGVILSATVNSFRRVPSTTSIQLDRIIGLRETATSIVFLG